MTAAERRCELTDLPAGWCAHCRHPTIVRGGHGPLDILADTILNPGDVGPRFTARFDGRCAICDARIWAGDDVAVLVDGPGIACVRHLS